MYLNKMRSRQYLDELKYSNIKLFSALFSLQESALQNGGRGHLEVSLPVSG